MSTARILYGMYFALTAIEVVLLMFGGLSLFDSLIHAFGSAGTGGFSNYSDSVGHFNSAYVDGVITVFMILFGVNLACIFYFFSRNINRCGRMKNFECILALLHYYDQYFSTLRKHIKSISLRGLPSGNYYYNYRICNCRL